MQYGMKPAFVCPDYCNICCGSCRCDVMWCLV